MVTFNKHNSSIYSCLCHFKRSRAVNPFFWIHIINHFTHNCSNYLQINITLILHLLVFQAGLRWGRIHPCERPDPGQGSLWHLQPESDRSRKEQPCDWPSLHWTSSTPSGVWLPWNNRKLTTEHVTYDILCTIKNHK